MLASVTLNGADRDTLYHYIFAMLNALKFSGLLVVNIVVAVIGTAILTTAIGQAFHARSSGAILWKEWSLSIGCAVVIGFGMWRTWRSRVAYLAKPRGVLGEAAWRTGHGFAPLCGSA
jgi:hypothetical protein